MAGTALTPRERALGDDHGDLSDVPDLEKIPRHAVVPVKFVDIFLDRREDLLGRLQALLVPGDAAHARHRPADRVPVIRHRGHVPRRLGAADAPEWNLRRRPIFSERFKKMAGRQSSVKDAFRRRIARQARRAVQSRVRRFAQHVTAAHGRLAARSGDDPAVGIVRRVNDRDRLAGHVDALAPAIVVRAFEIAQKLRPADRSAIQPEMFQPSPAHLDVLRARHDVARGVRAKRVVLQHEVLRIIAMQLEDRPRPAQRLRQ